MWVGQLADLKEKWKDKLMAAMTGVYWVETKADVSVGALVVGWVVAKVVETVEMMAAA